MSNLIKRPMLAAAVTEAQIVEHLQSGTLIMSPKLDGIRGVIQDGQLLSRSLKPIRNVYVQNFLANANIEGYDGELIAGDSPTAKDVYRKSNSAFMSVAGEPDFTFYVFDCRLKPEAPYIERLKSLTDRFGWTPPHKNIHLLSWSIAQTIEDVRAYEEKLLDSGFEGVILRRPQSPYKYNRSTVKEGSLLKLKRFTDSEAIILSVEELQHNDNLAETNELGLTKRSSHKINQRAGNTMGYLKVRDIHSGQEFSIGTGFDAATRQWFWTYRNRLIEDKDVIIKYKYFAIGVKDLPRHPVYLGLRNPIDL